MFNADRTVLAELKPHLARVLVVDPYPASSKLLYELLKSMGASQVEIATRSSRGYELAEEFNPLLIVTELSGPHVDGCLFTRRVRRSTLACRKQPVIVVTAEATAESIKAARDAGAHEFLKKPFTAGHLFRRVENVSLKPRPWVEAVMYVGPDRRRFNSGAGYQGPRKRRADGAAGITYAERIGFCLKTLRSALVQYDYDPAQAARSIQAQLEEMAAVALHAGDPRLVHAVSALDQYVAAMTRRGPRSVNKDLTALMDMAASAASASKKKRG